MKKILCFVMVLVLIASGGVSVFGVSAKAQEEYIKPEKFIYGDVDLDGVVTVKDATLLQKYIAGLKTLTLLQKQAAKTSGNRITVRNATDIQKCVADIYAGNSKAGATEVIAEPAKFKSVEVEVPATGDEIPFAQDEHTAYNSRSESAQYFAFGRFYVFDKPHYVLNDLDGTTLDNRYNDKYFEDNALIVMSFGWDSSSYRYRVDEIMKSDETLYVNYTQFFPESGAVNADVVNRRLYIEVSKADIKDIVDIVTYEKVELY